jgi:hypothetical protein
MLFRHPRADQREAPEGGKLFCFSLLRKVLILGFLTCGAGSDHRSPTNGRRGVLVSCGVSGVEALEEFALGMLHVQSGFGIGLGLSQAIQFRKSDVWPQVTLAAR